MFRKLRLALGLGLLLIGQSLDAREWSNQSGDYKINATLVAFDNKQVVVKLDNGEKLHGHELVAIQRTDLSKEDIEYLSSKEAMDFVRSLDKPQTWTMKNGTKIIGKAVDFGRRQVTIQSRRSKIYVNDKAFANLPEVYQRMVPRIVENFEKIKLEADKDFEKWVLALNGQPKTYTCEGVIIELENGDEYGVPFFLFSDRDLNVLRPGWEQWVAADKDAEMQKQHALYMQSQANNYQQNIQNQLAVQNQIGIAQLQMLAVASGVVDLWEVYLQPRQGVMGYPITVVVPAMNSAQASAEAMNRNPGYVSGPIRRIRRR